MANRNNDEERVAYVVEWDGKKFDKGVKKSRKSLDEFENQMNSLSTDKKGKKKKVEIDVDTEKANEDLEEYGKNVEKVKVKFSALEIAAVAAITNITNTVVDSAKKVVSAMSSINNMRNGYEAYEQNLTSMRTLINMYGTEEFDNMSYDEIGEQLEKLSWYCDETSVSYENLVNTLSSYATAGIDLDDATKSLMGFGNLINMYGGDAATVDNLVDNIGRAMNVGKMTSASWMQIASTAYAKPILEAAMESALEYGTLKKNIDGTYRTVSKKENGVRIVEGGKKVTIQDKNFDTGWLTDDVLAAALSKYAEYSNMVNEFMAVTEEASKSNTGLQDILDKYGIGSDTESAKYLSDYFGEMVTGFETTAEAMEVFDVLLEKGVVNLEYDFSQTAFRAAQQAKTFGDAIGAVTAGLKTQWSQTFEYIFGTAEETPKLWTNIADSLYTIFVTGQGRNDILSEWHEKGYDKFAQGISDILEGIAIRVERVREFFRRLFGVVDSNKLVKITDRFADFAARFANVSDQDSKLLEWADKIHDSFGSIGEKFSEVGQKTKELAESFELGSKSIGTFDKEAVKTTGIFNKISFALGNALTVIKQALTDAFSKSKEFFAVVKEKIVYVVNLIKESEFTWKKLIQWATAGFIAMKMLINVIKSLYAVHQVRKLTSFVADVADAFSSKIWSEYTLNRAATIKEYAISLALFAASIFLLSQINWDNITSGLIAMGIALASLITVIIILSKVTKNLGSGLGAFANAFEGFKNITKIAKENIFDVLSGLYSSVMQLANAFMQAKRIEAYSKAVLTVSLALIVFVGALWGLCELIKRYGGDNFWKSQVFQALAVLGVFVLLLSVLMVSIGAVVSHMSPYASVGLSAVFVTLTILIAGLAGIILLLGKYLSRDPLVIIETLGIILIVFFMLGFFIAALGGTARNYLTIEKTYKTDILQFTLLASTIIFTVTIFIAMIVGLTKLIERFRLDPISLAETFAMVITTFFAVELFIAVLASISRDFLTIDSSLKTDILQFTFLASIVILTVLIFVATIVGLTKLIERFPLDPISLAETFGMIVTMFFAVGLFIAVLAATSRDFLTIDNSLKTDILQFTLLATIVMLSVLIFVATIVGLTKLIERFPLDPISLMETFGIIITVFFTVGLFMAVLGTIVKENLTVANGLKVEILKFTVLLLSISFLLITLVAAAWVMSKFDTTAFLDGFWKVVALLLSILFVMEILKLVMRTKPEKAMGDIGKLALMMLLLSGSILIMVGSLILITTYLDNGPEMWKAFGLIVAIIGVMVGVIALLQVIMMIPSVEMQIKTKVLPLIILMGVIALMVGVVIGLSIIVSRNRDEVLEGLGWVIVTFVVLTGVLAAVAATGKWLTADKRLWASTIATVILLIAIVGTISVLIYECSKLGTVNTGAIVAVTVMLGVLMGTLIAFAAIIGNTGPVGWAIALGIAVIAAAFLALAVVIRQLAKMFESIGNAFLGLSTFLETVKDFKKDDVDGIIGGFTKLCFSLWDILPETTAMLLSFAEALRMASGSGMVDISVSSGAYGSIYATSTQIKSMYDKNNEVSNADLVGRIDEQGKMIEELQTDDQNIWTTIRDFMTNAYYHRYGAAVGAIRREEVAELLDEKEANKYGYTLLDSTVANNFNSLASSYQKTSDQGGSNNGTTTTVGTVNIYLTSDGDAEDLADAVVEKINKINNEINNEVYCQQ